MSRANSQTDQALQIQVTANADALATFAMPDLADTTVPVDVDDDAKYLKWDNSSKKWVDSYIKGKDTDFCSEALVIGGIYLDKGSRELMFFNGATWKNLVSLVPDTPRYPDFNAIYEPTVRWVPEDIAGAGPSGSVTTWPSTVGSGLVGGQGGAAAYSDNLISTKRGIVVAPTGIVDVSKWVGLDTGVNIPGSGGFTVAYVCQEIGTGDTGSTARSFTLGPVVGGDTGVGDLIALMSDFGATKFSSFFGAVEQLWDVNKFRADSPNPTVFVFRYDPSIQEYKIWFQTLTDEVVNTKTLDLDAVDIRILGLGGVGQANSAASVKVSEVSVWDTPLTDGQVNCLTSDLLTEYAVRSSSAGPGPLEITDNADVVITAPADGHVLSYQSGNWVNSAPNTVSGKMVWTYATGFGVPANGTFNQNIDNNFSGSVQTKLSKIDKDGNDQSEAIEYMCGVKNLIYLRTQSAGSKAQTYTAGNCTDLTTYYQIDTAHVGSRSYGPNNATLTDLDWNFTPYEA